MAVLVYPTVKNTPANVLQVTMERTANRRVRLIIANGF